MSSRKLIIVGACLLQIQLAAASTASIDKELSTYRRILVSAPTTLDPHFTIEGNDVVIERQMFDQLIAFDDKLNFLPLLARDWNVSPDGKTYTFFLRENVVFQDGSKFTSEDVVFSLKRVIADKKSAAAKDFDDIDGATDFKRGHTISIKGLTIDGPFVVRMRLRKRNPYFLSILASNAGSIVKSGPDGTIIGTGPFALECKNTRYVVLRANERYFLGVPKLSRIVFEVNESRDVAIEKLRKGYLDDIAPYWLPASVPKNEFKRIFTNAIISFALVLNTKSNELKSVSSRQAIAATIDVDRMLSALENTFPNMTRTRSFIPMGRPGYVDIAPRPEKTDHVRRVLATAFGTKKELIGLFGSDVPYRDRIINGITESLQKVGIKFIPKITTYDEWDSIIKSKQWHLAFAGFEIQYPDTYFMLKPFHSKGESVWLRAGTTDIDRLLDLSVIEENQSKRFEYFKQINQILVERGYVIPIYAGDLFDGYYMPWVQGVNYTPTGYFDLQMKSIYIDTTRTKNRKTLEWSCK